MAALFFYQKPVVLNRDLHRKLKIRSQPSLAYSAKVNSIPLTAGEFVPAARQLPIVFVQDANGNPTPVALLGLRRDENLFVDADGRWMGSYVPAFIRRYPFVLIEKETPGDFMVGIDEQFPGFDTDEGEPLFAEDGSEGPPLKRALEFLNAYQTEARRTLEFMAHLKRLDLLIPRVINVNMKGGVTFTVDGFSVVDEAKLMKLGEKEAGSLLQSGVLGWIYMHLLSIHNLQDLSARLDQKAAA
ncbi:MAG TPA: SapC family protein [Burkholderiales bacterium]|nr:SapC family protein [Burkholderiales bacterium]